MSGSRLLLAELAADLRSYLIQEGGNTLIGSAEMASLFSKQRKATQQAPAFLPSGRPQAVAQLAPQMPPPPKIAPTPASTALPVPVPMPEKLKEVKEVIVVAEPKVA